MKEHWLANTRKKLESGKLTVGYFGGSITYGSGASDPEKTSWRAGTTAWLKDRYPKAGVTGENAAIGGTGSDLGAFRCRRDLVPHLPDLVFIEFAVNDGGMEKDWCQRSLEGIIRHLWSHRSDADIVLVYTAVVGFEAAYAQGTLPEVASWHQEVADYYGIPSVNVGKALWDEVALGNATWEELLPDGVHPSDRGYAIYTDTICGFLETNLDLASPEPLDMALPNPMTLKPLWDGQLWDSWKVPSADAQGWSRIDGSLCGTYPHYLEAVEPGAELSVTLDGTILGIYWMVAEDSGDISWSVDDGGFQSCRCWDEWGKQFRRSNYRILAKDLVPGEHRLRIRVAEDKAQDSTGTAIRIGAFLVAGRSERELPLDDSSRGFEKPGSSR